MSLKSLAALATKTELSERDLERIRQEAKRVDVYDISEAALEVVSQETRPQNRYLILKSLFSPFFSNRDLLWPLKSQKLTIKLFETDPSDLKSLRLLVWDLKLFTQSDADELLEYFLEASFVDDVEWQFFSTFFSSFEVDSVDTSLLFEASLAASGGFSDSSLSRERALEVIDRLTEVGPQVFAQRSESGLSFILELCIDAPKAARLVLEKIVSSPRKKKFFRRLDIYSTDDGGLSLIEHSFRLGSPDLAAKIIRYCALYESDREKFTNFLNRQVKSVEGSPPIFLAALMDEPTEVIKALTEAGSDPTLLNQYGDSLLSFIYQVYRTETEKERLALRIKKVLDAGIDPNLRDSKGQTLLFLAAKAGDDITTQILLEYGADTEIKDSLGRDVLELVHNRKVRSLLFRARVGRQGRQRELVSGLRPLS